MYLDTIIKNTPLHFISQPKGFGWAPDRHFRARIMYGEEEKQIILKRCWSIDNYNIERYVYNKLSPYFSFKVPYLYYYIAIDGEYWLIMEDVGPCSADSTNELHRTAILQILGHLHGIGTKLIFDKVINDPIIPCFDSYGEEYINKKELLVQALQDKRFFLTDKVIHLYESMWSEIRKVEKTIIHGDTDFSNMIVANGEYALIDFEKCKIGPSIIDFSKIVEFVLNKNEYQFYIDAYCKETGIQLSFDQILHNASLSEIYDNFHWIWYDIKNAFNPSYSGYAFNQEIFLHRLNNLMTYNNIF